MATMAPHAYAVGNRPTYTQAARASKVSAAPLAKSKKPISYPGKVDLRGRDGRKCCAAAFGCTELASACGGRTLQLCRNVRNGTVEVPKDEKEREGILSEYRRKRKNTRQLERQAAIKEAKKQRRGALDQMDEEEVVVVGATL